MLRRRWHGWLLDDDRNGYLVSITCGHWSACDNLDGGCCALNLYGGRPSFGVCNGCEHNPARGKLNAPYQPGPTPAEWGPAAWSAFHARPLDYTGDAPAELAWLTTFANSLPGGCACKADWRALVAAHPPDLSSAEAYARWGWSMHEAVNAKLSKSPVTWEDARRTWGWDAL